MKKTKTTYYAGAMLVGLIFPTCLVSTIGAHIQKFTDEGIHFELCQNESSILLNTNTQNVTKNGQSGMSLRGFYNNTLFSCRGLT